ncbi:MAG: ABC transporter permease [Ruminococcaceae bacterium]|nr:ABC transporter permease [Oscillospiraceae bacterium]
MKYIARKAMAMLVTLFVISVLAFLAFEVLPGDPTTKMLGTDWTPERAAALREELGLNAPTPERYLHWLGGFFGGDFGVSYSYGIPVGDLLQGKLPVTLCLSLIAFCMVVVISIPVALFLARREGSALDRVCSVINQIAMSIPPFFIGIIFTSIFGLALRLFVAGSFVSAEESLSGFLAYLIFPALSIALPKSAMTVKLLRSSILNEMGEDYVRTAYSRGNSRKTVLRRHVLRNSIIPVITFLAVTIADIVAGSIIIEQVFNIPGLGRLLLLSISNRDFPVVLSIIMIIATIVIFVNFLADVAYQLVDPRIRLK